MRTLFGFMRNGLFCLLLRRSKGWHLYSLFWKYILNFLFCTNEILKQGCIFKTSWNMRLSFSSWLLLHRFFLSVWIKEKRKQFCLSFTYCSLHWFVVCGVRVRTSSVSYYQSFLVLPFPGAVKGGLACVKLLFNKPELRHNLVTSFYFL